VLYEAVRAYLRIFRPVASAPRVCRLAGTGDGGESQLLAAPLLPCLGLPQHHLLPTTDK